MLKRLWNSEKRAFFKAVQVFEQTILFLSDLDVEPLTFSEYTVSRKHANVNQVMDSLISGKVNLKGSDADDEEVY